MSQWINRIAWVAVPLLIGVMIGMAWSDAARNGAGQAAAADGKTSKGEKAGAKVKIEAKPRIVVDRKVARGEKTQARKGKQPIRVGSAVGVNRETLDQYVILHKYVWPEVLKQIRKSGIRNYTIYLGELDDGNLYLFSHFEYVGDNFEADMAAMANDPVTREWWKLTDPLQKRVKNTPTGSQWKTLKEVFHTD
jgi:L-rhamnose mutarotase